MEEKLMAHHTLPLESVSAIVIGHMATLVPRMLNSWALSFVCCVIKCGYKLITLTLTTALGITGPTIQTLPYEHHEDVK